MVWVWRGGEPVAGQTPGVSPCTAPTWSAGNTPNGSHVVGAPKVPLVSIGSVGKDMPQVHPVVAMRSASPVPGLAQPPQVLVRAGQRPQSPSPARILPQPVALPTLPALQVAVPVESLSQSRALGQLLPLQNADKAAIEKNLLLRIDGVVSEMERELSEDMQMCTSSSLCDAARGDSRGHRLQASGGDCRETTIDWIDKQIWAIEHRREACEMRQAHLADLRRIVAEGRSWGPTELGTGSEEGSVEGSSTVLGASDEEPAAPKAARLAALEAEHELLKKQVECEREELLRVRAALEGECEGRLAEVRSLAEAVEGGKRRAWAAEEAANQRAREAGAQAEALQERLQRAEAACEHEHQISVEATRAQVQAMEDLRLLEENSRAVLDDCRALQVRVHELQFEREALVNKQAGVEEERRMFQTRIKLLEEQRSEAETQRQALADENYSLNREHSGILLSRDQQSMQEESALLRREALFREELAQRDATLAAARSSWCQAEEARSRQSCTRISELENELARALSHGESQAAQQAIIDLKQQVSDALAAEAGAEQRVRAWTAEAEQRHLALVAEAESLRSDLVESRAAALRERRAREEVERRHRRSEADAERACEEHRRLSSDVQQQVQVALASERHAREEAEQQHSQVVTDAERLRADHEEVQVALASERHAREEVEQQHLQVVRDAERLRADHEELMKRWAAEQQALEALEQKHQEAKRDNECVLADSHKLQKDLAAEQQARQELEIRHKAIEEEKRSLHVDKRRLETLMEEEQFARQELERRHKYVEHNQQQLEADHQELLKAREDERQARVEAERRHQAVTQELEQIQLEQQKLQRERDFERRAREELEKRREEDEADRERLLTEHKSLKADLTAEQWAREDAERKLQKALQDVERQQTELHELQAERAAAKAAREEAQRGHHDAAAVAERLRAEQPRLQAEASAERTAREEAEQRCRELEAEHRRALAELREAQEALAAERRTGQEQATRALRDAEQQLREELEQQHREERERLRNSHQEARGVDRQAYEELERRYGQLAGERQRLHGELERMKERHDGEVLAREAAERSLRLVHDEREALSARIADLLQVEGQQDSAERSLRQARAELEGERRRSAELERQLEQVRRLEEDLEEQRSAALQLKEDLEQSRLAEERLKRDAEEAMGKSDEAKRKVEVVWKEKLDQAKREIEALKGGARPTGTRSASQRKTISHPSERLGLPERQNLTAGHLSLGQGAEVRKTLDDLRRKHSLWAEPGVMAQLPLAGLPESSAEGPRQRLREVRQSVLEVLESANRVHCDLVYAELEALSREGEDGFRGIERAPEMEQVRSDVRKELKMVLDSARALKEEVQAEQGMASGEQQQILDGLEIEISRCEEEFELLERESALKDIPETLVQSLVNLTLNPDAASTMAWYGDFSPMHWCALNGRRDIIEFIRQQPWGAEMVNSRDLHGRTPRFYAEREKSHGHKRIGLIHYLREEAGATASPCQPKVDRPKDLSMLQSKYLEILSTVEREGMHAMKWKDGYTMLHWAAERGHGELCEYLIRLGADMRAQDSQTRTPIDCANKAGHAEIARAIQELMENPREWVFLSAFPSKKTW